MHEEYWEITNSNGIEFLTDGIDAFAVYAEIRTSQARCRAYLNDFRGRVEPELGIIHIFHEPRSELRIDISRFSSYYFSTLHGFDNARNAIQRGVGIAFQWQWSNIGIGALWMIGVERSLAGYAIRRFRRRFQFSAMNAQIGGGVPLSSPS